MMGRKSYFVVVLSSDDEDDEENLRKNFSLFSNNMSTRSESNVFPKKNSKLSTSSTRGRGTTKTTKNGTTKTTKKKRVYFLQLGEERLRGPLLQLRLVDFSMEMESGAKRKADEMGASNIEIAEENNHDGETVEAHAHPYAFHVSGPHLKQAFTWTCNGATKGLVLKI